jgi:L-rhamnose mutarotase
MQKFCLTLDLKNDPNLIAQYEDYHKKIPDAIDKSIRESGILNMQIYRFANRLFMIIEADDTFSFANKARKDAENIAVQEWESLMWQFQQALPEAKPGEKWMLMEKIFDL